MNKILIISFITILFTSAFYFFAAQIAFYYYLVNRGVKVVFGLAGLPYYLEYLYRKSDSAVKGPKGDKLVLSIKISFLIMVISGIIVFLFLLSEGRLR